MIFSVPHSGTRTLQELLCLPGGSYRHFGIHDGEIAEYKGNVHIPLRDPYQIARSWSARGLPMDDLIRAMRSLVAYVQTHEVTFHRMESLPNLIGEHPARKDTDFSVLEQWMRFPEWQRVWGVYDRQEAG